MARVKVGNKGYVGQRMRDELDKPKRARLLRGASNRDPKTI